MAVDLLSRIKIVAERAVSAALANPVIYPDDRIALLKAISHSAYEQILREVSRDRARRFERSTPAHSHLVETHKPMDALMIPEYEGPVDPAIWGGLGE
jgi:hypothetical protein